MKLYIQDHGVYGMITVIADDENHAREIMRKEAKENDMSNYAEERALYVYPIVSGFFYENYGGS